MKKILFSVFAMAVCFLHSADDPAESSDGNFVVRVFNKNLGPVIGVAGDREECPWLQAQRKASRILAVGKHCFATGSYITSGHSQYWAERMMLTLTAVYDDDTDKISATFDLPYVGTAVAIPFKINCRKGQEVDLAVGISATTYGHTTSGGNIMTSYKRGETIAFARRITVDCISAGLDLSLDFGSEALSWGRLSLSQCTGFTTEGTIDESRLDGLRWMRAEGTSSFPSRHQSSADDSPGGGYGGLRQGPGYVFVPKPA